MFLKVSNPHPKEKALSFLKKLVAPWVIFWIVGGERLQLFPTGIHDLSHSITSADSVFSRRLT